MDGFTKSRMLDIVRQQLAIDMNCKAEDFLNDGIVFSESRLNEGRRTFERQAIYLEIATMGKGVVISVDQPLLENVEKILYKKTREDIFALPFVYGHSLYYIPEEKVIRKITCPEGFSIHIKEGTDVHELYQFPGFQNAISYDPDYPRPDVLVIYAMNGKTIAAMAGASADCKTMWQIGIDVLPQFRNIGLASFLVRELAIMILERGVVPYYGVASSNIPSQSVAYRSGLAPTWMCSYKNIFDGKSPYDDLLRAVINQINTNGSRN